MESNIQNQSQPAKQTGTATARATSAGGQTVAAIVSDAAHAVREQVEERSAEVLNQAKQKVNAVREQVEERGAEVIDQAKQKVTEAYDQTNKRVNEQYVKAVDYGHENPGLATLIAVGVGVGIGLALAGCFSTWRSRA